MKNKQGWRPLKFEELSGDSQNVLDVLNDESDLACVLIGTSYLAEVLSTMLKEYFIETSVAEKMLDPQRGSLGQFAVRADIAYWLGLIRKYTYHDLIKIAEIRNLFAHKHIALSFTNPTIQEKCEDLGAWRIFADDTVTTGAMTEAQSRMKARNQFKLSVVFLGTRMHLDALGKGRSKEKI